MDKRPMLLSIASVGLGITLSMLVVAILCAGCSEDHGSSIRGNNPPVIVSDNPLQEEAVIAQIDSFSELKGPVDLGRWAVWTTSDPRLWSQWQVASGVPSNASGWLDRTGRRIFAHADNGAGHTSVCEAVGHELEHLTNPTRPHPFTEVDAQARACSLWLISTRAP